MVPQKKLTSYFQGVWRGKAGQPTFAGHVPPSEIAGGLINHWFPLIRPY